MPTYEFRCPDGSIIERVFKMSEVPDAIPSPNGDGMATRIISGGADLIFKGSGFYITDYGKDGKKAERSASELGRSKSEGEKGESAKGESGKGDSGKGDSGKGDSGKGESGKSESGKSGSGGAEGVRGGGDTPAATKSQADKKGSSTPAAPGSSS